MKAVLLNNGTKVPLQNLSFAQTKQAAAVMDCIGRLIPHEGVDYEVEIIFKSEYNPSVSLNIKALTDKGKLWKDYLTTMIAKYPPVVDYHGDVLPYNPGEAEETDNTRGEKTNEHKEESNG